MGGHWQSTQGKPPLDFLRTYIAGSKDEGLIGRLLGASVLIAAMCAALGGWILLVISIKERSFAVAYVLAAITSVVFTWYTHAPGAGGLK